MIFHAFIRKRGARERNNVKGNDNQKYAEGNRILLFPKTVVTRKPGDRAE